MNSNENEENFKEEKDSSKSSRNRIYVIDLSDKNNDGFTILPFIPTDIVNFGKITLQVLDYNVVPNNSKIRKNVKIYIYQDSFKVAEDNEINHNGRIDFGREGVIRFEEEDKKISRFQFHLEIKNKIPYIVCLCSPPKMPTSFVINDSAFFLEKDHV